MASRYCQRTRGMSYSVKTFEHGLLWAWLEQKWIKGGGDEYWKGRVRSASLLMQNHLSFQLARRRRGVKWSVGKCQTRTKRVTAVTFAPCRKLCNIFVISQAHSERRIDPNFTDEQLVFEHLHHTSLSNPESKPIDIQQSAPMVTESSLFFAPLAGLIIDAGRWKRRIVGTIRTWRSDAKEEC